jgi:mono/diheme cytochrome c family protein
MLASMRMPRRALIAPALVLTVGLAVAGCGGGDDGGSSSSAPAAQSTSTATSTAAGGANANAAGKKVFATNCKSCHTLADAQATGTVGPNLDDLKPDEATVKNQVINGGGPMPAFGKQGILTTAQIDAVSKYVSSVAGQQ